MEAISSRQESDALQLAKRTIQQEAESLSQVARQLGVEFVDAINALESCTGAVIVTGMGKAGLVGQKISATLCSTGTRSHFLHPAEAIHGDLGRVTDQDWVLALSMSGETEELTRVLPSLRGMASGIVAVTGHAHNTLARQSDVVIALGPLHEADSNGLAPSTSTTTMLAIGDALALTISQRRGFQSQDFVRFHPGGSLGRKLTKVQEVMRPLSECRLARPQQTVRETVVTLRRPGRRTGAVMIVDQEQRLVGVFTDSDLAKLLERRSGDVMTIPVGDVMTKDPHVVSIDSLMPAAIEILAENQISELPVLDDKQRPAGLIDITDVVGWLPNDASASDSPRLLRFPSSDQEQ